MEAYERNNVIIPDDSYVNPRSKDELLDRIADRIQKPLTRFFLWWDISERTFLQKA